MIKKLQLFFIYPVLLLLALTNQALGQLTTTRSGNYGTMSYLVNNVLLGKNSGITATNITYQGIDTSFGYFNGSTSNIGMDSGLIITNGSIALAQGPNCKAGDISDGACTTYAYSTTDGWPASNTYHDTDLANLISTTVSNTYSCAVLQFDFIANADTIEFQYSFGSNEEPHYVGSSYLDDFGFFLSGPGIAGPFSKSAENLALIPSTTTPVYINSVNCTTNSSYYVCNWPASPGCASCPASTAVTTVGYNGFTTVLTAKAAVICGQKYHIKLGVADIGNGKYDSGVFLKGGSFKPNNIPMTVSPASATICSGNNVTLTAANETTYTWSPSTGLSASTGASVTANPTVTTTYTVIGSTSGACNDTSKIVITVNPTPTVTVSAAPSASICVGGSSTITAAGATTYTWSPSTGLSATTGASVIANPSGSTLYTVTGTSSGCSSSNNITIAVNPTPTITASATSPTICAGNSTFLNAGGGSTYTWTPNTALSATTGASVIASPTVTTTYTLNGLSAAGCSGTPQIVVVTVNATPTLTASVTSPTICSGNSTTLNASGASTYTWTPNTALSATTGASVTATPGTTITYTVNGSSAAGCPAVAKTVVVTVNPTPTVTASATSPTICSGNSTTLNAGGATTYTWIPNTALSATTGASVTANPGSTITYTVTGTSAGCSGIPQIVVVTVNATPTLTASATSPTICSGNPTTLNASGASTYTWTPNTALSATTGASVTATPGVTTTYTVNGSSAAGCPAAAKTVVVTVNPIPTILASATSATICSGSSTTLNASGGSTYTWIPNTALSATTGASVTANPGSTITYTVTGTSASGCVGVINTVVVTVNPTPTITVAPISPTICPSGNVNLTASGATTYTWGPSTGLSTTTGATVNASPASTTTYTINGTSTGCPGAPVKVVVTVAATLSVTVTASSPSICSGNNTILNAGGAATYIWKPGTGLSCTNCPNPTASPSVTTTYEVYGSSGGCSDSAKVTLTVNPTPTVSINITSISASICPGDSLGLIASGATNYSWAPATGLNCSTCDTIYASPNTTTTYTLTGTDVGGCTSTTTQKVTVYPVPTMTVTPNSPSICSGSDATLTATGVSTYTWSPASGLSATTGTSVVANPTTTTTYTITGIGTGGCIVSEDAVVKVNPTPTVTLTPSSPSVCTGDSVSIAALGAVNYSWQPSTGLNCTTCATVYDNSTSVSTYTVIGTNGTGCTDTTQISITINPTPTISVTSSAGPAICSSDTTTLTATGGTTYTWSPATGLSSTSGSSVHASPGTTTTYTVTALNASGCKASSIITISINPTPTLVLTASKDSICSGGATTLTATGASTYTWSPNTGLSASTGSSVTASPGASTTYTITGTSGAGCPATGVLAIGVTPTPSITVTPPSPGICPGDSVTLTASGATTYLWNTGATSTNITVHPASTTTYTVTGNNGACSSSGIVSISVGTLTVTATASSSTICSGNNTTLTASGALNYSWKPGTGLSATTGNTVTATLSSTTTYSVTGTSGSGCLDSSTVVITVNPTPTVNVAAGSPVICAGATGTTLTASGASGYIWSPGTGLLSTTGASVAANPPGTQTYTITGTTAGCTSTATITLTVDQPTISAVAGSPAICLGSSVSINATGGSSYTWSPATGLSASIGATVTANPTISCIYEVVGTDAFGCSDSTSVSITVDSLPTITAMAADTSICSGNSSLIVAIGTGSGTFAWIPATGLSATTGNSVTATPSSTTTYTVTETSSAGCVNSAQVSITVNSSPTISIALSGPSTLCPGASVTTLTASGATVYTWSPANGLSATTGNTVVATPITSPIVYTVIGLNGVCSDSAKQTISLYPPLNLTMTPGDSSCSGQNESITATASGGEPAYNYVWTPSLGTGPGPYVVNPTSTTIYNCTITDGCGNTVSGSTAISVYAPVKASFYPTPDTVMGGQPVAFIDSSSGPISTYWWAFGDGTNGNQQFPYHMYPQPGRYYVELIVTSNAGCRDTLIDSLFVTENIYVPNVFTPNGDGQNDVFHISSGGMQTFHIEIFNRWGEKVFQSDSPEIDWDGRSLSGVAESDGTYYYIINATDYAHKAFNFDGYVQLIR